MANPKIVNVHRITQQHGSLVVVIPVIIRGALELDPGSYLVFELDRDTNKVEMSKFETKGADDVPGN